MKNNKGVSLVEVMIALVLFLIVFMGLMQTALLSIDSNVRNVQRDEAITFANGELDHLKNVPFDDPQLNAGTTCRTVLRDFRNIRKQYNVCNTIADLSAETKNIEVVVGWDHKRENAAQLPTNREFQHSISALRRGV